MENDTKGVGMDLDKEIKRLNDLELLGTVFAKVGGFGNCADAVQRAIQTSLAWVGDEVESNEEEIVVRVRIYRKKK